MGNKDYNIIGSFCRNNWSGKDRVAAIITCLLEHAQCDPNCVTHDGQHIVNAPSVLHFNCASFL